MFAAIEFVIIKGQINQIKDYQWLLLLQLVTEFSHIQHFITSFLNEIIIIYKIFAYLRNHLLF